MSKRTNTARWTGKMWRIDVQHDGKRKSFYSSKPGRTGQREANAKADAWLDDGINPRGERVAALYPRWFATMQETTSTGNCRNIASRWKVWILPMIGNKRITSLTEQNVQEVVNKAYAAGKSKKTLKSLCADMRAFFKYCRLCKLSTFNPEALHIPAGARYRGKQVLQPSDLVKLFNTDTTTYNGQTVPDEYINAYRFQVLTGLRPGEKLYEELLMDAERDKMGKTAHNKIFIAPPMQIDLEKFYTNLQKLKDSAKHNDDEVVDVLQEMVPTYHPNRRVRADHTVVAATGNTALFSKEEVTRKLQESEHKEG